MDTYIFTLNSMARADSASAQSNAVKQSLNASAKVLLLAIDWQSPALAAQTDWAVTCPDCPQCTDIAVGSKLSYF